MIHGMTNNWHQNFLSLILGQAQGTVIYFRKETGASIHLSSRKVLYSKTTGHSTMLTSKDYSLHDELTKCFRESCDSLHIKKQMMLAGILDPCSYYWSRFSMCIRNCGVSLIVTFGVHWRFNHFRDVLKSPTVWWWSICGIHTCVISLLANTLVTCFG